MRRAPGAACDSARPTAHAGVSGPAPDNAGTGDWVADDEIYSRMRAMLDSYVLELDAT